jgi:hypothetical protein
LLLLDSVSNPVEAAGELPGPGPHNHNQGLRLKTGVRAENMPHNHNQREPQAA